MRNEANMINTKDQKPPKIGWCMTHSLWWHWWDGALLSFGCHVYNTSSKEADRHLLDLAHSFCN
jgi:hypothetical protein